MSGFDPARKGPNVVVTDRKASTTGGWATAFLHQFDKGSREITFEWVSGPHIMVGVCSGTINHQSAAYSQAYSMMLYSNGPLYITGSAQKTLQAYSVGSKIKVQLDCDRREVMWTINNGQMLKENLHNNLQPPFSLCVDMNNATVRI